MNLSKNIRIRKIASGAASAGTAVASVDVDFSNYDGVLLFGSIATANAANNFSVEQKDPEGNYNALAGTVVTPANNGMVAYVDVYRPLEGQGKIVRAKIDRSGAVTATGDIYAILYNGRIKPENNIDDAADGITGVLAISPVTA